MDLRDIVFGAMKGVGLVSFVMLALIVGTVLLQMVLPECALSC